MPSEYFFNLMNTLLIKLNWIQIRIYAFLHTFYLDTNKNNNTDPITSAAFHYQDLFPHVIAEDRWY